MNSLMTGSPAASSRRPSSGSIPLESAAAAARATTSVRPTPAPTPRLYPERRDGGTASLRIRITLRNAAPSPEQNGPLTIHRPNPVSNGISHTCDGAPPTTPASPTRFQARQNPLLLPFIPSKRLLLRLFQFPL